MDPLSDIIALMRPKAVAWCIVEAPGACSVRFPATEMVAFGQLIEGEAVVALADGIRSHAEAGDFVLLAAPPDWFAHIGGGGPEIDLKALIAAPERACEAARGARTTRFVAGAFEFAAPNAELLCGLMPPLIHVRVADFAAGRLGALLRLLEDEALSDRPGRSLVLDRLLEILLVEAIRPHARGIALPKRGLVAGLADPKIGATLSALHAAPGSAWTVAALARQAGMSRSAFAERFADKVGAPPMDYLYELRMNIAKSALTAPGESLARLAERLGYRSASALSTAFRRATGVSPSRYAREASVSGAQRSNVRQARPR